jgi:hypothetical protein
MKIEVKPFNGLVHFAPAIHFLPLKRRLRTAGAVRCGLERDLPRKTPTPVRAH